MITVSLEMAKKLEEAGWEQKSCHFVWVGEQIVGIQSAHYTGSSGYSAPTAEEVLRELPATLEWKNDSDKIARIHFEMYPDSFQVGYSPQWEKEWFRPKSADTLANAAAAMWIHLKDN